jgi:hypothetical protein
VEATSIVKHRDKKGRVADKYSATITAEYEIDAHGNRTRDNGVSNLGSLLFTHSERIPDYRMNRSLSPFPGAGIHRQ